MARGQRAATKKMGLCALRVSMGAMSTARTVLQKRGVCTVPIAVSVSLGHKELYRALHLVLVQSCRPVGVCKYEFVTNIAAADTVSMMGNFAHMI